jgi:ATP-dependent DNA helicase DinG
MAEAVAGAVLEHRHLIVRAGTGTGKSLAYLVPVIVLGARAVISTATKALQDQLAQRDLPRLAGSLGVPFQFAVLKGRSNYVCRQRVSEVTGGDEQLVLGDEDVEPRTSELGPLGREVRRLVAWAASTSSGDRAELPWEPSPVAWAQVSVGSRDCPGASRCPSGGTCFAENARRLAGEADVIVVNTYLYASSLAIVAAELLPPHDLVVFDEAHEVEDIVSAALGLELGAGRLAALARAARPVVADGAAPVAVGNSAVVLAEALRPYRDKALPRPLSDDVASALTVAREGTSQLLEALRQAAHASHGAGTDEDQSADGKRARRLRAQQAATHLLDDLDHALDVPATEVAWVEGPENTPLLRVAPLDVGAALGARLWQREDAPTAVLASATVPPRLGERLGLPAESRDELDVGSPFAYEVQALLYCPVHLPPPNSPAYEAAMHEELVALIEAAQGRTLALFTSWRAMRAAAELVRQRVSWPVMTQSDLPKPKLLAGFSAEEHSCLFATMGFWQGVDIPGPSLSLVTIDRLPFARPDDPLFQARRAHVGRRAFELVDLPRAATLLAQGAGRLIRSSTDRGVVAVLDRRLGKARYRWELVRALPPMRRTRSRAEVEAFLISLRGGA